MPNACQYSYDSYYRDTPFTLDGVARHVLYRGIVTGGRTYGLYLSAPADQWTKSTGVFTVAADTFRTS